MLYVEMYVFLEVFWAMCFLNIFSFDKSSINYHNLRFVQNHFVELNKCEKSYYHTKVIAFLQKKCILLTCRNGFLFSNIHIYICTLFKCWILYKNTAADWCICYNIYVSRFCSIYFYYVFALKSMTHMGNRFRAM